MDGTDSIMYDWGLCNRKRVGLTLLDLSMIVMGMSRNEHFADEGESTFFRWSGQYLL